MKRLWRRLRYYIMNTKVDVTLFIKLILLPDGQSVHSAIHENQWQNEFANEWIIEMEGYIKNP